MSVHVTNAELARLRTAIAGSYGLSEFIRAGVDLNALAADVIDDYGHADPDRMHGPRVLAIARAHLKAARP